MMEKLRQNRLSFIAYDNGQFLLSQWYSMTIVSKFFFWNVPPQTVVHWRLNMFTKKTMPVQFMTYYVFETAFRSLGLFHFVCT